MFRRDFVSNLSSVGLFGLVPKIVKPSILDSFTIFRIKDLKENDAIYFSEIKTSEIKTSGLKHAYFVPAHSIPENLEEYIQKFLDKIDKNYSTYRYLVLSENTKVMSMIVSEFKLKPDLKTIYKWPEGIVTTWA